MKKPLILVGAGEFAQIAYEYFTHDSEYEVKGFAVERDYLKESVLLGLPVMAYEDLEQQFPPSDATLFVAIPSSDMNQLRTRFYHDAKGKGYRFATYVSSQAFVWRNAIVGENTFIFENNVVQPFVSVGNNCVLWSGNHVGHRTVIRDNVFIASHAVISGYCDIGENCFIGVNATINDNVKVGSFCVVGSGGLITKDAEPERIYVSSPARPVPGKTSFDAEF